MSEQETMSGSQARSQPIGVEPIDTQDGSNAFAKRSEILTALDVEPEVWQRAHRKFPVRWPKYYLELARRGGSDSPLARMGRPSPSEWEANPFDIADPISDRYLRPVPFVVRKHRDRVIILCTKKCHFYCRFCFRREESVHKSLEPSGADWLRITRFIRDHPEIREPILSGGDPLTLSDEALSTIRDYWTDIASVTHWRIHTRAPVHFPQRVTEALMSRLAAGKPLRMVTHFNHPDEITSESKRIAELAHHNGVEIANQTVLLCGVNDRLDTQAALWRNLHEIGIEPYYLHHPDRVTGNAPFRLTLARGMSLFHRLRELGGPCPRYVLDLPDGRGKVPVLDLEALGDQRFVYRHGDGSCSHYQDLIEETRS